MLYLLYKSTTERPNHVLCLFFHGVCVLLGHIITKWVHVGRESSRVLFLVCFEVRFEMR